MINFYWRSKMLNKKRYTQELKDQILTAIADGMTVFKASEEFGPTVNTINNWRRVGKSSPLSSHPHTEALFHLAIKNEEIKAKVFAMASKDAKIQQAAVDLFLAQLEGEAA
jgi:transposase-like protein